jgi:two-component system LytT family response regulator
MKQSPKKARPDGTLEIRDGSTVIVLSLEDIDWVDAAGDYMCVHALGETYIMRTTMKQLEAQLDAAYLQRIHRSTIVNVNRIKSKRAHMNGEYFITLKGGHTVKLSRSYKHKLPLL